MASALLHVGSALPTRLPQLMRRLHSRSFHVISVAATRSRSRPSLPCVSPLPSPFLHRLQPARSTSRLAVTMREVALPKLSKADEGMGFGQLGLCQELVDSLDELDIRCATEIQAAAIPVMLAGKDAVIASHTGSGKTLAYYLPLVQRLRDEEAASGAPAKPRRPRALLLGPTRELTDQITRVGKALAHRAKFRSTCLNGGGSWSAQRDSLEQGVEVVVGTPMRVLQHYEKGNLFFGDVAAVVLDEADTMFDAGFGPEVRKILAAVRGKPAPASATLVAATLSRPIQKLLAAEFPAAQRVETSSLHRGVAGAAHAFLPLPGGQDKLDLLRQMVHRDAAAGRRVIVFCNTLGSARAADHALSEAGLPVVCYHGDVPLDARRAAIEAFAGGSGGSREAGDGGEYAAQPLLVATDLAARGLDIPGQVHHVVNFDFPRNPVDYIHRAGRTARAGQGGRITSIVTRSDKVLAGRIEEALNAGLPLDQLSADRRVLPPHMRPKTETLQRREQDRLAAKAGRRGVRGAARLERGQGVGKPGAGKPGAGKAGGGRPGAGKPGVGRSGAGKAGLGGAKTEVKAGGRPGAGKSAAGKFGGGKGRAAAGPSGGAGRKAGGKTFTKFK